MHVDYVDVILVIILILIMNAKNLALNMTAVVIVATVAPHHELCH